MVHLSGHSWIAGRYHLALSYDAHLRFEEHEFLHEAPFLTIPDFYMLFDHWIYYEHLTSSKWQQRDYGNHDYFANFRCPLLQSPFIDQTVPKYKP